MATIYERMKKVVVEQLGKGTSKKATFSAKEIEKIKKDFARVDALKEALGIRKLKNTQEYQP
ncbi:unnamed protein product [marine sediment metagenome]|uniref:Uncharacterized protein n=1 Tax=marine sediment metagenome TaxID=412755 RepID=X1GBI8_9ZZZZ